MPEMTSSSLSAREDGSGSPSTNNTSPLSSQPISVPVKLIRPLKRLKSSKDMRPVREGEGNMLQTVMEEAPVHDDGDTHTSKNVDLSAPADIIVTGSTSPPILNPSPPLSISEVVIPVETGSSGSSIDSAGESPSVVTESLLENPIPQPVVPPLIPVAQLVALNPGGVKKSSLWWERNKEVTDEKELPEHIGKLLLESCLTENWTSFDSQIRVLDQIFRGDGKRDDIVAAVNLVDEETGFSALMLCAKASRINEATMLLKLGAQINVVSKGGESALHLATQYAKDEMIRVLVTFGADATMPDATMNRLPLHIACLRRVAAWPVVQYLIPVSGEEGRLVEDKDGLLPIWLAAMEPNIHAVKELLSDLVQQQLSYQNKQQNGDTLMHFVLRRRETDTLRALIDAGAPINMQNFDGQSLLHIAAMTRNDAALALLHDHKADPEVADRFDRTPLHLAVENGSTAVVEVLTEKFKGSIMARTSDGSTLAHLAALTGHPEAMLTLLRSGVPLNMPNKAGALALHAAARAGHVKVIGILIENGSAVDAKTNDNYTSLHLAVEYGKPHVTEALLGYGALVDIKGGVAEETALHIAARVPSGELCAEMLIKSGADVNATMQNGETALHVAARSGALRMVQILLTEKADTSGVGISGETPLHVAVRNCNYHVAKELLEHSASQKSKSEATGMVNAQNSEGESAMHYAAEIGSEMTHFEHEDMKIVQLLLDYHAEIGLQTKMSLETPIHYCARCGNSDILTAVIKYLGPIRLQTVVNKQAKNGWSPLLTASEHGHEDIVKLLLRNNARVDVFDEQGKAALHVAAENGQLDIVDYLLRHKAFVNAKSKMGITPLHLASMKGHTEIVELLVEKFDAAIDSLSLAKKTPLHMAAQYGKLAICEVLLKMKADPNAKDQKGQTPLHLAAENDHSAIVGIFLKAQADSNPMSMVDENGYTVAHIAAKNGSTAVIKLLINFNKEQLISAKTRADDSTAVHLAASGGHSEVVKILVEGGASPIEENGEGMTPLHLAAKFGHLSVLDALKELVSLKVYSVKTGFNALHLAAFYGQVDFARELLTSVSATVLSEQPTVNNAIVKETSAEPGLTPLHLASHSGQENMVRLLLNYPGVQVDAAAEKTGSIPLHLAAANGHIPVVGLLMSKCAAQLDVRDKKGRNALMLASSNGHEEMAALLIGQGADVTAVDNAGFVRLITKVYSTDKSSLRSRQ